MKSPRVMDAQHLGKRDGADATIIIHLKGNQARTINWARSQSIRDALKKVVDQVNDAIKLPW
jgi:hypothetical protein